MFVAKVATIDFEPALRAFLVSDAGEEVGFSGGIGRGDDKCELVKSAQAGIFLVQTGIDAGDQVRGTGSIEESVARDTREVLVDEAIEEDFIEYGPSFEEVDGCAHFHCELFKPCMWGELGFAEFKPFGVSAMSDEKDKALGVFFFGVKSP